MNSTLIFALFPIAFMIHDFEEIIMAKAWFDKYKVHLTTKFPKIGKRMVKNFDGQSTASFALAVALEFIIISFSVFLALQFKIYWLWFILFMAFFIHLVIHIGQWFVLRVYIPAIITSFFSLVYCIYTITQLKPYIVELPLNIVWLSLIGLVSMGVNLFLVHKMASKFEKWLRKYSNKSID